MSARILRSLASRVLRDRRGASAVMLAAGSAAVFGAVALATDGGVWYSNRRAAQNAADSAASAGVVVLAASGANQARTTSLDVSSRNGFAHNAAGATTVQVNIPPSSGPQAANTSAVEVIVRQVQPMTLSALLLSSPPTVAVRSVATLRASSNVCILALTGQVWVGGNATVNTPNCVIASNRRDGASIQMNSGALDVYAYSLSAVGRCQDCDSGQVHLSEQYGEFRPPTQDPFARLQSKTMPTRTGGCGSVPNGNGTLHLQPYEDNGRKVYCGIQVNGGREMQLSPGTYYIHNGGLTVQGGGSLTCPSCSNGRGVAIVLTGDAASIGEIRINANSNVQLRAAREARDPDYNGVLLYRDVRAPYGQTNNPSVQLNGGTSMGLAGALYFPSTHVRINGNAAVIACSVIVAASIDFIGNADVSGCNETGTAVPQTRRVVMTQ
jgi:Flp pilus assembly protein TadG